jgi:hypothetical protein
VPGAGILRGEAWFQDLSMRQGAGMTSWPMLTLSLALLCSYLPNMSCENCKKSTHHWAPGPWNLTEEEEEKILDISQKRFPVIISTESIFSSPKVLQDFLHLPFTPQVIKTGSTASKWYFTDVQISDVSFYDYCKLRRMTEGESIVVWFEERWMSGWFARSLKIEKKQ